jgi:hypothetical protein
MKRTLIALLLLAGAVSGVRAGIILSDDFPYLDGGIVTQSVWLANSGATLMDVTNHTLIVAGNRAQDIYQDVSGGPYLTNGTPTALYARFTMNCTYLPGLAGQYFTHFCGTNAFQSFITSGFRARVWASLTNYPGTGGSAPDPSLGQFNIGIANSGYNVAGATGTTNWMWATPLVTNHTYTIVTRYVLATGASTLWVDPAAESDTSVTDPSVLPPEPTDQWPTNGVLNISGYGFRQSTGAGDMWIDNLRIGTRFSDVAGANQSPAISTIADQSIPGNGNTGQVPFTVEDPESPANELNVTATSDNLTLVPNGSPYIVLGSDSGGTNRTIKITSASGQQGSANISVRVSDSVNASTNTFKVTVGAPTIGAIPNQITSLNTATPPIVFTVGDTEGDSVTLTVADSSNPTLVPLENIQLGVGVLNVSSNVVVTPAAGQSGVTYITISANDGHNTKSTSFAVTVKPSTPTGLVYTENFAYTGWDSASYPNALYNATGGSGAPWHHVSGTLSYELCVTNITGTSGLAYIVHTNNEDLGADFISSAVYDGSLGYVFYTSFTVNSSLPPSYLGEYFFHLSASGLDTSNFRDKVYANNANAADGKFRFGIANTASSVTQQFPRDLMTNATYAVVTRYNAATGDSTLWVNPVNEQSSAVTASDNAASSTIGGVALRQAGCCTGDLIIGPMKVGWAFNDVWTAPTRPILNIVRSGGGVKLSWTDSSGLFVLQSAPSVKGPYTDVQDFTNPYTYSADVPQYFRLSY